MQRVYRKPNDCGLLYTFHVKLSFLLPYRITAIYKSRCEHESLCIIRQVLRIPKSFSKTSVSFQKLQNDLLALVLDNEGHERQRSKV